MAPAKRAASNPPKSPKKAKAACKHGLVEPRYAILEELKNGGMAASCLDMLSAALPHALETPKEDRHQFQIAVIENLLDVCGKERSKREEQLSKAEAALTAQDETKIAAAAKLATTNAEELARREKKMKAQGRADVVTAAANEAARALEEANAKASAAESLVVSSTKEKDNFVDTVYELWRSVRDSTFDKKDWRQRQKTITEVTLFLKPIAPESLVATLPLALKEGLDDRGPFAKLAVEETERLLMGHRDGLHAKIDAAKADFAACTEAVAHAESMLKDVTVARDQITADWFASENDWLEAEEARRAIAKEISKVDSIRSEYEAAIEEARESVQALEAALAAFKVMQEPPAGIETSPAAATTEAVVA